jgi:hypothetical protein
LSSAWHRIADRRKVDPVLNVVKREMRERRTNSNTSGANYANP